MPVYASESEEPRGGICRPQTCGLRCPDTHVRHLRAWNGPKSGKNIQLFFFTWRVYFKYLGIWYMGLLFWAPKMWRAEANRIGSSEKIVNSLLLRAQIRQPRNWVVLFLLLLLLNFFKYNFMGTWKVRLNVAFSHSSGDHAGYGGMRPGPWL